MTWIIQVQKVDDPRTPDDDSLYFGRITSGRVGFSLKAFNEAFEFIDEVSADATKLALVHRADRLKERLGYYYRFRVVEKTRHFISLKSAAKLCKLTPEALLDHKAAGDVFAYRDGASWKFKAVYILDFAASLQGGK